jgi:hypothetical protein
MDSAIVNKYSLAKVYEIVCNKTGKRYVGSTCELTLSRRLSFHKSNYKRYVNKNSIAFTTSFHILEGEDFYINLLEKVNATCKDELLARERHFINTLTCVNKCIPLRSASEYYKDNIEEITAKKSEKINCECGGYHRKDNKVHHLKTDKHITHLQNIYYEKDLKEKGILIEDLKEVEICSCCGVIY